MDRNTQNAYQRQASSYIQAYDQADVLALFAPALTGLGRVLDIGCGSGRDMRAMQAVGIPVDGVDPCAAFVQHAKNSQPNASIEIDSLPELATLRDASYGGILCSAVLMHIPPDELFDSILSMRRILKENGRIWISIPLADPTIVSQRDASGRLFSGITPDVLECFFERAGFRVLHRSSSNDGLNRPHRKWENRLFERIE